jgi:hypothetical protein
LGETIYGHVFALLPHFPSLHFRHYALLPLKKGVTNHVHRPSPTHLIDIFREW